MKNNSNFFSQLLLRFKTASFLAFLMSILMRSGITYAS